MAYKDLYEYYYKQIESDISKHRADGRRFVLGYTSDLDVILEWDGGVFSDIISQHLGNAPVEPNGSIDSMQSFASIVSYYMIHGLGGEIDITDINVCEYLESRFKTTFALGGTCAQGAAALNAVGYPVTLHITDRSKEVIKQLDSPGVETVTAEGIVPIARSVSGEPPVRHMILQYPKGFHVNVNGRFFETPVSNRLIMDYDSIHKLMPVDECFLEYCERHAKDILVYSVSGFNGITDPAIMEKKAGDMARHYRAVKERNPGCNIFLEGAHYLNADIKSLVFEKLADYIDIYSMNEEELVDHTGRRGVSTDKDDLSSILNGLNLMLRAYPVKGLVLHTKDYSMYYGRRIEGMDVIKGLTTGNLMSATRARTGRYGSLKDCGETLQLPLSTAGIAFAERLSGINTEHYAYLVPSRYMENPKYTIGLGDTFMAGFLTSFVNGQEERCGFINGH